MNQERVENFLTISLDWNYVRFLIYLSKEKLNELICSVHLYRFECLAIKEHGAKFLQEVYLWYLVTFQPTRLYFGTDITQSSQVLLC